MINFSFLKTFLMILIIGLMLTNAVSQPSNAFAQNQDQDVFLVSQKAFDDGFYDVSLRYLSQLLNEYPDTKYRVKANLLIGQCYFFKNQYLKAYESFEKNINKIELSDATNFWIGETYLKGADYRQAEHFFQKVITQYPDSDYLPQAYYSMGWLFFERQDFEKARDFFQKLTKNYPKHALSADAAFKIGEMEFNLRHYQKAIKIFQTYQNDYPQTKRLAETYFYLAESNYYLDDFLTATAWYAKTSEESSDPNLILMSKVSLGWCYTKLKRYDIAKNRFDEAAQFAQEKGIISDDIYLGIATLNTETGNYPEALVAFDKVLTLFSNSPRSVEAYLGKANVYYQTQQFKDAINTYQSLINNYEENSDYKEAVEKAYFGLAWSYLKSGDISLAVGSFKKVQNIATNETVKISALTQIGDAWQDAENYPKAIEIYDQILIDHPDSAYTDYVQYRQGVALLKMGQLEAATMSFQSLERNFPNSAYNQDKDYYLAVAYFKKGDWQLAKHKALDFLENQSKNSPFMAEANYILGMSYFNLQNYDQSVKTFQQIIRNYGTQISILYNAEIGIAKAFYRNHKTNEALKKLHQIILKYPKAEIAEEALILLGDHYAQIANIDEAITHYAEFVQRFPGSDQINIVRFQLAQAYEAKSQYDTAIDIYKSITPEGDRILNARAKLAIADIFSMNLDPEAALNTYTSILASSPEFKRNAYLKIAEIQKSNRQYPDALNTYEQAIQTEKGLSDIDESQLQFLIADTYELMNENQKAADEYLKLTYLFPDDTQWVTRSYLRAARIFEDAEKWKDASKIYQKVIASKYDEAKFARERLEWIEENTPPL